MSIILQRKLTKVNNLFRRFFSYIIGVSIILQRKLTKVNNLFRRFVVYLGVSVILLKNLTKVNNLFVSIPSHPFLLLRLPKCWLVMVKFLP